ncbi:hypothetical protein V1517DRAFT_334473 [Lipomyces orientalis]|uniref:Uncharacterized protein n=1 Tax=Lipomyces orientalis TaxID=1233043 RepID=A0ACC3TD80_9ASCO
MRMRIEKIVFVSTPDTFSAGARGCFGRNISYLERPIMIASLVHRYEFELPSPDWELELKEHVNL